MRTHIRGAAGPLVVSTINPRYFAIASELRDAEQIVYLTGSHVNNNFHDGLGFGSDCPDTPERFDYGDYLKFLHDHGHNFIRLWRWEQFKGRMAPVNVHFCMTPQPWRRTGPGTATDGKPRFDLSAFDPEYFERLRDRVTAAGNEGIYVSVMLFEGFSLHVTEAPNNVEGHPFHRKNNVNDIGITSVDDCQVLPLDRGIQALEEAYIRQVIDTVQDLPNVLYEVANESPGGGAVDPKFAQELGLGETSWGDTTAWQYFIIDFIKSYERQKGYVKHPVGMTMQFPVADQRRVNDPLFKSPADWISPGPDDAEGGAATGGRWLTDPPPNTGAKVIISDTDHYSPFTADALWAWKSFLRGHNPILYDLGIVGGANPGDRSAGTPSYDSLEAARYAMGDTLRFARKAPLADMEPRGDLSSTAYALAAPGRAYLVLEPIDAGGPFTLSVDAGTYSVEWHNLTTRETIPAQALTTTGGSLRLKPPTAGPAVLFLSR